MLMNLIPAPYRWLAWLALAVVIAGVGAWGGHKATAAYYQPKVAKAEARAAEFESAYGSLARAAQNQNDAINRLQDEAKAREEQAAKAIAQARAASSASRDKATAIMGLRLPAGADECSAARDEFDDELKFERGRLK